MTDTGKTNWISPQRFGQRLSVDPGQGRCRFQALPKGARPLSADNILIRPFSGSSSPASARLHINALSPLTHISGCFNTDGCAGPRLRPCSAAAEAIPGAVLEDASGQAGRCGAHHYMDVCPGSSPGRRRHRPKGVGEGVCSGLPGHVMGQQRSAKGCRACGR